MDVTRQLNAINPKGSRWTLKTFLQAAKLIHGDSYDYSKVREEHIKSKALLPLTCNLCGYKWTPRFDSHINARRKCRSCAGQASWTLKRFIERSIKIYGPDVWDLSNVEETHIQSHKSKIRLVCKLCGNDSYQTIHYHMQGHKCGLCRLWTLETFLAAAKEIHGDKYDYSAVTEEHMYAEALLPISCRLCGNFWTPPFSAHIYQKSNCNVCRKLTLQKFLLRAAEVHGQLYDYSRIIDADVITIRSYVSVICRKCDYEWPTTIDNHLSGHGCPACKNSHGERVCFNILRELNVEFSVQYKIGNERYRYDFKFEYKGKKYIIEFDGIQHFKYTPRFHKTQESFCNKRDIDVRKTEIALYEGFTIIRIDFAEIKNVKMHIKKALKSKSAIYVSNADKYSWIIDSIVDSQ